jgi:hypothetical protein
MTGARVADHANGAARAATLDAQGTAVHVVPGDRRRDVVLFWGVSTRWYPQEAKLGFT